MTQYDENSVLPESSRRDLGKPYRIMPDCGTPYLGDESDIQGLQRRYGADLEVIISLITRILPDLERVAVLNELVDKRGQKSQKAQEEERLFEVVFPKNCDHLLLRKDEIEETLDEELTEAGVGEIMGAGGRSDGSFDFAVNVDPRRAKAALRVIRKVLLKFNVPEDVKILEQCPS